MPKRSEANRKTNICVARGVPVFLLALIGYASWVITKPICIDYLIAPPRSPANKPRPGTAAAILVTYYLVLLILLISYGRLLETVTRRPGLIPRGPQWYVERSRHTSSKSTSRGGRSGSRSEDEKSTESDLKDPKMPKEVQYLANESLPFRVEDFWLKDVFVCNADGRPPFCSTCYNWKPDRSHHCSELNRCVLKLDHFCPWVGGVVSETSFKYFILFTFYGALYNLDVLVVVATLFAERRRHSDFLNAHWVVIIAISALFLLFSAGMCMSTGQFALINSTTIENLSRKTKVWHLAVYASPQVLQEAQEKGIQLRLISYPRPPQEQLQMLQQHGAEHAQQPDLQAPEPSSDSIGYRTFAILETGPGANPFHLGFLANFQDIMGATIWEWFSLVRPSPCLKHDDPVSLYKLGPIVDELKAKTGLRAWTAQTSTHTRRRRRRRTSSRVESTMHGDGSA